jgi:hypothetical protein
MAIDNKHNQYHGHVTIVSRVRDAVEGSDAVKGKRFAYLPMLEGQLQQDYDAYLTRACWTNYSNRMLEIMAGNLYKVDPVIEGIKKDILDNIDLCGSSFNYWSKRVLKEIIVAYRIGVLVDYNESQKRPFLTMFATESIINWRTAIINGAEQLTMIVLEKERDVKDEQDEYKTKKVKIYRKLFLDGIDEQLDASGFIQDLQGGNIIYKVEDYQKTIDKEGQPKFELVAKYTPMMNDNTLDYLPFYICTPNGRSLEIKNPIILDLVDLNYSHYRTSADYENMSFYYGNPSIIVKNWPDNKKFALGGVNDVGTDGDAKFLELSQQAFLENALTKKQEQIAILGSSMMAGTGRYVASADTSNNQMEAEHSVMSDLSNAMDNCFETILACLQKWGGEAPITKTDPTGEETSEGGLTIEFKLDIENDVPMNPQFLTALIGAYQSNIISYETLFYNLQQANIYSGNMDIKTEWGLIQQAVDNQVEIRDKKMNLLYAQAKLKGIQPAGEDKTKGQVKSPISKAREEQNSMPSMQEMNK